MQKKSKFFFGLCVLVVLFVLATPVLAASSSTNPAYLTSVSNVTLSNSVYNQGDTVNGSFAVANSGTQTASDLYYRISLAGQYDKNQISHIIYGQTDLQGPISVAGGQKTPVNFSYVLPAYVGGNGLGIKVELMTKQGQLLGWGNAVFTASSSMSAITINTFSIGLGGNFFIPSTGPTIHKGETPTVVVDMVNPLKTSLTLTAQIKVYNRVVTGNSLYASTSPAFTLAAGAKKSVTYTLPTFDNAPGVYAGTITFVDATGASHSPTMEFRYIIGGDIVTIQSVNTGSGVATKGQPVNVSVMYSGAPLDTRTVDSVDVGKANLSVTLYNEKNELVGSSSISVIVTDIATKNVAVTALVDAQALRADAVITKGGKTLATFSTSLSPVLKPLPPTTNPTQSPDVTTIILAGLGFLVIVFVFWLIFKKHKKNLPPPVPPTPIVSTVQTTPVKPIAPITPVAPVVPVTPTITVAPVVPVTPVAPKPPVSLIPPATVIALVLIAASCLLGFSFMRANAAGGTCTFNDSQITTPAGFSVDDLGNCVSNIQTFCTVGSCNVVSSVYPSITGPVGVFINDVNEYDISFKPTNYPYPQLSFGLYTKLPSVKPSAYYPVSIDPVTGIASLTIPFSFTPAVGNSFGVGAFYNVSGKVGGGVGGMTIFAAQMSPSPIAIGSVGGPGGWILTKLNGATAGGRQALSPSSISLTSPETVVSGGQFTMGFVVKALQCSNSAQIVTFSLKSMLGSTDNGVTFTQSMSSPIFIPATITQNNGSTSGCTSHCIFTYTDTPATFSLTAPMTPGKYRIAFEVEDRLSSDTHGVVDGYKDITVIPPAPSNHTPNGAFGQSNTNCSQLVGWACDLDSPTTAVRVKIYADAPEGTRGSTLISETVTNVSRDDLGAPTVCNDTTAKHGFNIPIIPRWIKDGATHNLYAYAVDVDTNGVAVASPLKLLPVFAPSPNPDSPVSITCAGPTSSLTPATQTITSGSPATLTSNASLVQSCVLSDSTGSAPITLLSVGGTINSPTTFSNITQNTTYTLTCTAGSYGNDPTPKTANVLITGAPVNGSCSISHSPNPCSSGVLSGIVADGGTSWTWSCSGQNGGSTASCSEMKIAPVGSGTLSCVPEEIDPQTGSLAPVSAAGVGDQVTWEVLNTLGTMPSGSYTWSDTGVTQNTSDPSFPINYSTIGNKTMSVVVGGASPVTVPCTTFVHGAPVDHLPVTFGGVIFQPI